MLTLLKFVQEQRDQRGRFTGTPSVADGRPAPAVIRADGVRSLTRGEGWQRMGAKIHAIPVAYTGSQAREKPIGSFTEHRLVSQIPASMNLRDDAALRGKLYGIVKANRDGAVEKAKQRGLIPADAENHMLTRAYNHGAMLALHDHGIVDYDFKMDDHLKEQMKPLEGFIRYSRRRVKSQIFGQAKGSWKPYRQAFGKPFRDGRTHKITGETRLRVRPNDVLIKSIPIPSSSAIQPLPQGTVDRWDRQRLAIARKENQGDRSYKPLTVAQKTERKHAAIDERLKVQQGAPKLTPGMIGSIRGLGIAKRPALNTRQAGMRFNVPKGSGPYRNLQALVRPLPAPDLTKAVHPAVHDMMPDELKHITKPPARSVPAPKAVKAMMPEINAILALASAKHDSRKGRFQRTQAVADHKAPLTHLAT